MAVQPRPHHVVRRRRDRRRTAVLGDALIEAREAVGEITLLVAARVAIVTVLQALRDTPGLEYQQLMEIAGVDYPERAERFEVVYHLLSLTQNRRIRVKLFDRRDDRRCRA